MEFLSVQNDVISHVFREQYTARDLRLSRNC